MRNVIYLVFAFLILGCGNEDELTSKIEIENLYGIQDDPSDPVKHRVFEMYSEYGIPVYFNEHDRVNFREKRCDRKGCLSL